MTKANNKKICIVVSSLGIGGAEKSSALLSILLNDLGFDIYIVSVLDCITYNYKGQLLNLGQLKKERDSHLGRLNRLLILKKYIKQHKFNYIIDNRSRIGALKEFIISRVIYKNTNVIYSVHSFNTKQYITPNKFIGRIIYGTSYKIVVVSKAISEKLKSDYNFKNIEVIYNPIEDNLVDTLHQTKDEAAKYILFYGRLDNDVKNISLLLSAYKTSLLPANNIKLKLLGDGKDLLFLQKEVITLQLSNYVEFLPYNPNPQPIVKNAFFTVLTSKYEGFPLVLIESLAIGTPVVSVDCKSGPNEIITNKENGLLVENFNADALATAMNTMLEDKQLYLHCKTNAQTSVAKFSKAIIAAQWQSLLK